MHAPPAAIGDSSELLDVYMHEFSRGLFLVSHDSGFPEGKPGRAIEMGKFRHPVTGEDAFDRGTRNPEVVADAMRSPLSGEAERDDAMFPLVRQSGG